MNDREAARAQQATLTKIDQLLANFLQGEITRAENKAMANVAAAAANIAPQPAPLDDALGKKPYLMVYEKTKLPASIKNCGMNGEVRLSVLVIAPDLGCFDKKGAGHETFKPVFVSLPGILLFARGGHRCSAVPGCGANLDV